MELSEELSELFQLWRQARQRLDQDTELTSLRAEARAIQARISLLEAPLTTELTRLEAEIRPNITETTRIDGVEAAYRSGYTRVTWDSKRLDGYAAAHPEILTWRKATEVAAAITIRLRETEERTQ